MPVVTVAAVAGAAVEAAAVASFCGNEQSVQHLTGARKTIPDTQGSGKKFDQKFFRLKKKMIDKSFG